MKINHENLFNIEAIEEHYSKKDGTKVTYVCTTDLSVSDVPMDIFYRETPHPEFGNRYLGLYWDHSKGHLMITNADSIESLEFGMIEEDGKYYYSKSHHDYKQLENGKMIDGGRAYIKSSGTDVVMRVINGKFIAKDVEDLFAMKEVDYE